MYNKILVANRGEIAVRVIRACRELGIKTVAIHSTIDKDSLHVKLADEAICVGPAPSSESYLKIPAIISAAEVTGAQAIHPGYGFLSEDGDFAEKCQTSGIDFIGPSGAVIKKMGDKISGRQEAEKAGVPVTPGVKNAIREESEVLKAAEQVGYPLMIKASAGGGGKGMRVVFSKSSLMKSYEIAKAEAEASFGNDAVYIEKFIEKPRHIEVQIIGDKQGNMIHLGERDCSIQRRNQKIIEESPAPNLSEEARQRVCKCAVDLGKSIGYYSAGTIEFLMDKDENFYFMEMNTRLQVEHPVTEMVTGFDLVKEQIWVAYGNSLRKKQEDIQPRGSAIEFRINAEHPETFAPSPGKITGYHQPGGFGVRVETLAFQDYVIQPHYDSLISKLICHGENRERAIARAKSALDEYVIEGVHTLIPLHLQIIRSLRYQEGKLTTDFVKNFVSI